MLQRCTCAPPSLPPHSLLTPGVDRRPGARRGGGGARPPACATGGGGRAGAGLRAVRAGHMLRHTWEDVWGTWHVLRCVLACVVTV